MCKYTPAEAGAISMQRKGEKIFSSDDLPAKGFRSTEAFHRGFAGEWPCPVLVSDGSFV
jgi:hypothetical protein